MKVTLLYSQEQREGGSQGTHYEQIHFARTHVGWQAMQCLHWTCNFTLIALAIISKTT